MSTATIPLTVTSRLVVKLWPAARVTINVTFVLLWVSIVGLMRMNMLLHKHKTGNRGSASAHSKA